MRYPGFILLVLSLLGACSPRPTPLPSSSSLPSVTATSPATATHTPPPTWTHVPTTTPTPTLTPSFTPTLTPSETPAPLAPAKLFPFKDADGHAIDWAYAHLSSYVTNEKGVPILLSASLAFQLMDRAIHRETIPFDEQTLTIYYLNVQHEFGGQMLPAKLILSATTGQDVPLSLNPAGGGSYIRMRILPLWQSFDAPASHIEANETYSDRSEYFPDVLLLDLQTLLPTLPSELIVLADAQILFDLDQHGLEVKYNIDTVPYLAARAMPFLALDDYDRITGPSPEAASLENALVHLAPIPGGIPYYSSDFLVLIPRTNQFSTLP